MAKRVHKEKTGLVSPQPDELKRYIRQLKEENKKSNAAFQNIFKKIDKVFDKTKLSEQ